MKSLSDLIEIRPYADGDEAAIVACYNAVFPTPDGSIPKRTLDHWQWKFRRNPAHRMLHMVAEHRTEGIVGTYAGIPVRLWAEQSEQTAAQGVDFVVQRKWRRYGDPGLFVALGRAYIDRWHGSEPGDVLFTYGWPVPAWRAGSQHLGYLNIRDWDCTFKELDAGRPRPEPGDLETRVVARFGAEVDALWQRLRSSFELATVRDSAYLNWRYADRPEPNYHLLECREKSSQALRGIAVYGAQSPAFPGSYLTDWLAFDDDEDATVSLLAALERLAVRDGARLLGSFWNHMDPRFLALQHHGYRVKGTEYFVVLATAKYETRFFRDHWYLTLGDSDLI